VTNGITTPVLQALWTAVACVDAEDTLVAANDSYLTLLGLPEQTVIGGKLTDFASRAANEAFFAGLDATRVDGRQRRVRNHSLDFDRVFDNIFSKAGDFVVIEVADVTDEVREHDRRVQIQSARDVIWERVVEYFVIVDLVDKEIVASPAVWERWPISQLELWVRGGAIALALANPHRWSDEWADESSLFDGRVERAIAEVFTSGQEQRHQAAVPLSGSQTRYFDTHLVPWRVEDEIRGVVIISHDQTAMLRYQDQRTMAEKAMAQLLADLPVSVWEIDAGSQTIRPLFADRRTPTLPTWGQPTPLADYLETLDEDSRIRLRALLGELTPDRRASLRISSVDHDRHAQISLHQVPASAIDQRRRILTVVTDVTNEVSEAEAQNRVDHATHVMRFAQGVAHDFGNVAQVVGGYSDLLTRSQDPRIVEQASTHLASAARRAVSVSQRIATIAKVQQVANGPLDISAVIRETASDLKLQLGEQVDLVVEASGDLFGIAERGQVASALENLCQNAAQAMKGAGRIAVTVVTVNRRGRDFVEVTVADNGPGIPPELRDRVFDPFVTGRPDAGTGLGLYLIQEYLYSVRGEIEVESSDDGATFHLRFPVAV
jgi:signal transduction histidine kinase